MRQKFPESEFAEFLHEAGRRFPDETALSRGTPETALPFRKLLDAALSALPAELSEERVVATQMPPTFDHALLLLGAMASGRPIAPFSTRAPDALIRSLAATAGAKLVVRPATSGGPLSVISDDFHPPGTEDFLTVLFTSGSSGEPKAVFHTLAAHLASANASTALLPLQPGDAWLADLPMNHVSGLSILFRCLSTGATISFAASGDRKDCAGITHRSVVSTQLRRLLDAGLPPPSGLRAVLAGGGPFPAELVRAAVEAGWPLHLTYGMTEFASQICTSRRLEVGSDTGCAGFPLPGIDMKIQPDGQILARGPMLPCRIRSLHGQPIPFLDANGFLATGDIGVLDADAGLRLVGRRDRMFISGGENIHPEAIERALLEFAGVHAAAVVAIPDREFGRRPVAFVLTGLSPEELREALRTRLPAFCLPVRFLPFPGNMSPHKPEYSELAQIASSAVSSSAK